MSFISIEREKLANLLDIAEGSNETTIKIEIDKELLHTLVRHYNYFLNDLDKFQD